MLPPNKISTVNWIVRPINATATTERQPGSPFSKRHLLLLAFIWTVAFANGAGAQTFSSVGVKFEIGIPALQGHQTLAILHQIEQEIAKNITTHCNENGGLPWHFTDDVVSTPWIVKIVLHQAGSFWNLDVRLEILDEETGDPVDIFILGKLVRGPNDPLAVPSNDDWDEFFPALFRDTYLGAGSRSGKTRELRDALKEEIPIGRSKVYLPDRSTETRLVGALLLRWDQCKRWARSAFVIVSYPKNDDDPNTYWISSDGLYERHTVQYRNTPVDVILIKHKKLGEDEFDESTRSKLLELKEEGWIFLEEFVPTRNTGGLPRLN